MGQRVGVRLMGSRKKRGDWKIAMPRLKERERGKRETEVERRWKENRGTKRRTD